VPATGCLAARLHGARFGYVVLGAIVERISGLSYAAFLHARIFGPLGMTRTGVYTGAINEPGHALGYLASGAVAPTRLTVADSAAGAIYSTTGDLYRWDQALITGTPRLVTPTMMRRILTVHAACPPGPCPLPGDRGYGYGWFIGASRAGVLVHHSGSVLGSRHRPPCHRPPCHRPPCHQPPRHRVNGVSELRQ